MNLLAREHVVPHASARLRYFAALAASLTRFALQVALRRLDFDPDEALTTLSHEVRCVRYASATSRWFIFRMVAAGCGRSKA